MKGSLTTLYPKKRPSLPIGIFATLPVLFLCHLDDDFCAVADNIMYRR
jgi:hypothetical protein